MRRRSEAGEELAKLILAVDNDDSPQESRIDQSSLSPPSQPGPGLELDEVNLPSSDDDELVGKLSSLQTGSTEKSSADNVKPSQSGSDRNTTGSSSSGSSKAKVYQGNTSEEILRNIVASIDNYDEIMTDQRFQTMKYQFETEQVLNQERTCSVWASNMYPAFAQLRSLLKEYSYIAMDTEFPGIVVKFPQSAGVPPNYYKYEEIRTNVDKMKLIQLGLTLMDVNGNTPPGIRTFEFNFKFSLKDDAYSEDSIKLLVKSGLQFLKHESDGIDHFEFAYLFYTSGLVLKTDNPVTFITFHSGYDFAYLTTILTGKPMPEDEASYIESVKTFFPRVYDVKYLMLRCPDLYGGLQDVAQRLGVIRHGFQHQAGSDSLITGQIFFQIRDKFFGHNIAESFNGRLFGFNVFYSGSRHLKSEERGAEYY